MKDTRGRILESAIELFAAKGFLDTTVADICDRAGANVAAVNYYFGSKEKLFQEVLQHAFEISEASIPFAGNLSEEAGPEERMRVFLHALLFRILDEGPAGYSQKMMAHEMSNLHSPVRSMFRDVMRPYYESLRGMIREYAGVDIPEFELNVTVHNVISICAFLNFHRRARTNILEAMERSGLGPEDFAEHVMRFALGGVRAVAAYYRELS